MYEINQKVSWICEGEVKTGSIVGIVEITAGTLFELCEAGSHPRNGVYERYAKDIQAI